MPELLIHNFLIASIVLFLLASILPLVQKSLSNFLTNFGLTFLGCASLFIASTLAIASNASYEFLLPIKFGLVTMSLKVDPLSGFFLLILSSIAIGAVISCPAYIQFLKGSISPRMFWVFLPMFLLAMICTLCASDGITFLVFWELMAISSFSLVALEYKKHAVQKSASIYLASTRISSTLVCLGFLMLYAKFGSFRFCDWLMNLDGCLVAAIIVGLGFAIKAGLWPFHIWLPYAHPAAPAPVSALMSGIMVKIPLYAIIRLFITTDMQLDSLGITLIILGAISSFWGILFGLVQDEVKKLLAYSTVENIGIISFVLGLSIYCLHQRSLPVAHLALSTCLFYILCHSLSKALLFISAGTTYTETHTLNLNQLGGLAKRLPITSFCFLLGAMSIASLPPLAGFGAKWFVYQSLLSFFSTCNTPLTRFLSLTMIGLLSLVGALSLATIVKAFGIGFLGKARSPFISKVKERSSELLMSQIILCLLILLLGIFAVPVFNLIERISAYILHNQYLAPLGTSFAVDASIIHSELPLPAIIVSALIVIICLVFLLKGSKRRNYITWECGFGSKSARMEENASSFTQPAAQIFSPLFLYKINTKISGKDRRHFPEHVQVDVNFTSVLETYLYRPFYLLSRFANNSLQKLQTSSIHIHLLYVLLTLIVLLCLGVKQ